MVNGTASGVIAVQYAQCTVRVNGNTQTNAHGEAISPNETRGGFAELRIPLALKGIPKKIFYPHSQVTVKAVTFTLMCGSILVASSIFG